MSRNRKGFATIPLIFIIVALLAVAAGVYKIIEKKVSPDITNPLPVIPPWDYQNQQVISSSTTDETANWKTYQSEKYGYEINYPSNWYAFVGKFMEQYVNVTGQDDKVTFGSINPIGNPKFLTEVNQDYQELSIERQNGSYYADSKIVDDFWNKLSKNDEKGNLVNKFKEKRFFNGEYFILFDQYNWEVRAQKYLWSPQAVFMHNGNIFWVRPSFNVSEELFNSFLSTFKFTP